MASASAADTWRETGARSTGGRPLGERPARPPLPPLPPLPAHGRADSPGQRPATPGRPTPPPLRPAGQGRAAQRPASQARPAQRPSASAGPREQADRAIPGHPRAAASAAPRSDRDEPGPHAAEARPRAARRPAEPAAPETGSRLHGSLAVLGVLLVTLAAGFVDTIGGSQLGLLTLAGLVGSTALATLLVRKRDVTTLVVAPPLVYVLAVAVLEFVHRAPGDGFGQVVTTVAAELALGQGFTVMATATGTALVLALIRWAARR